MSVLFKDIKNKNIVQSWAADSVCNGDFCTSMILKFKSPALTLKSLCGYLYLQLDPCDWEQTGKIEFIVPIYKAYN